MTQREVTYNGKQYKRITKATARRAERDVFALPVNYRPALFGMFKLEKGRDFDKWVNAVEYYNCNPEAGHYLAFYVEI